MVITLRKKREIKNRLNTSNGSRHSLTGSNLSLAESEGGFSYISIESQPRSLASQKTGKRQIVNNYIFEKIIS